MRRRRMLGLLACLLAAGCDPLPRFECGTPTRGDEKSARRCAGPGQRCVCATSGCVAPVHADLCATGYEYLPPPFGIQGLWTNGHRCLDPRDVASLLPVNSAAFCPGQDPSRPAHVEGDLSTSPPDDLPLGDLPTGGGQ